MSENPETQPERGLPAPPPLYLLTVAVDVERKSQVQFLCHPEEVIFILRGIADSMEAKLVAESDGEVPEVMGT